MKKIIIDTMYDMPAIETTYIGATGVKGSRVRAKSEDGKVIISYDPHLRAIDAHKKAAVELLKKTRPEAAEKAVLIPGWTRNGYIFLVCLVYQEVK